MGWVDPSVFKSLQCIKYTVENSGYDEMVAVLAFTRQFRFSFTITSTRLW